MLCFDGLKVIDVHVVCIDVFGAYLRRYQPAKRWPSFEKFCG